jgi:hypothetical protein
MAIPFAAALKYWKLVGIALLVLAIGVQTIRLSGAERRADRISFRLVEARQAIKEAHEASLRAQHLLNEIMKENRVKLDRADKDATRIESAPLPGNCATPKEIRELDI